MTALIMCEPGPLQDGLWDLLSAVPRLMVIGAVSSAKEAVKVLKAKRPVLVLVGARLKSNQEIHSFLTEIKANEPATLCIVVAGDAEQRKAALEAGADSVQVTGYPADALYNNIKCLLERRRAQEK